MNVFVRRVMITSTPASFSSALEPERHVEDEVGFLESARLGAWVVAAVARRR